MNYSLIRKCDMANGTGFRVSLFVSGCPHHCKGCFNEETWRYEYGNEFTGETMNEILDAMNHSYIRGFTLLGGEPMSPENQEECYWITKKVKEAFPDKDIWVYTGYVYEENEYSKKLIPKCEHTEEFLQLIDVLVDGQFIERLKDISLAFKGSSNQRTIDMKKTLENNNKLTLLF